MSEHAADVLPRHPEVTRDIDVIPVTPHTRERLLRTVEQRSPFPQSQPSEENPSQIQHFSLRSQNGETDYRISLLPIGTARNGVIANVALTNHGTDRKSEPLTGYFIKVNPDPEDSSLILMKRIIVPEDAARSSAFVAPSTWYYQNGYTEGVDTEFLNTAFRQNAEKIRKERGDIPLDQMGRVAEISEGEIRDLIGALERAESTTNERPF